uniref:NADH-ubiquinone oxidoreductase chain 3 n=1 Tax=Pseudachorutes palmiensis TaxID=187685 RepID=A0A650BJZ8_9HEXA|nr:NADH dehydrogenase subunit 3 [Pseudachorutes palmiensis]
MVIIMIMVLVGILPMILLILNLALFKKNMVSREKSSPFECGFDPKTLPRTPFSLKFYLISTIFLIFDIEIALILPLPLIMNTSSPYYLNSLILYFLAILFLGLLYEWHEGALNWLT